MFTAEESLSSNRTPRFFTLGEGEMVDSPREMVRSRRGEDGAGM